MNVLLGCESSGITRDAFIKQGFNAISCDFDSTEKPGPHLQCDVLAAIMLDCWDLIILHPVCTYMCVSGNGTYADTKQRDMAQQLTLFMWERAIKFCKHVALENPVSTLAQVLGKSHQTIQPWQHGHGEIKAICWWLHNLPLLKPTRIVSGRTPRVHYMSPGDNRSVDRSRWYPGIARAEAKQWGQYIRSESA